MTELIHLDLTHAHPFVNPADWRHPSAWADIQARLLRGDVAGGDFLGWLHWPSDILNASHTATKGPSLSGASTANHFNTANDPGAADQTLDTTPSATVLDRVLEAGADIRSRAEALVVIGIGGSYLGARAAFDWCKSAYYNQLPREQRGGPELYFAGNHLSATELRDLMAVLEGKYVVLNVISKSGGTTEPAVAFRVLRDWLVNQVGPQEAKRRIYATTDAAKGALKQLADKEGYETFVIPDDIGGRFSVLTPVGLLPLAAVGVDVVQMLAGAAEMEAYLTRPIRSGVSGRPNDTGGALGEAGRQDETAEQHRTGRDDISVGEEFAENPAFVYAAVRNALYQGGYGTEILAFYEPGLRSFAEWWKQLFGESEGKDGKGIFPASVGFTTDLHSLGQFVQDGTRNLFETVLWVENAQTHQTVPAAADIEDGLEYLAGRPIGEINEAAYLATQDAHVSGGVANLTLTVARRDERTLGALFYFFEYACAVSALMLGVNPFNQPGVEAYKGNMFRRLGKPGY
ncbi:glucose-6-phosphate isomerase [Alicyclobacillus sp. ALC3]|uniref:glucose-6-phosphate isomerase n=1 Tax=Alicyclobacillus sp. ALC3 TaxID=2796143 RepID=UPI00237957B8|nr:glucose-6-phosphate isomerase [Alicyclobacillus sp. ALC3]WDL95885.1 glucose-6-phosphate isomerase [Alicyclobacillus sp. ALC3]